MEYRADLVTWSTFMPNRVMGLMVVLLAVASAEARGRRVCCGPCCGPVAPMPVCSAEEEIRAVLDAQVASWNRRDLEGFMAGYWRSDELTFVSGDTVTHGWQATLDRYRKRYQGEGKEMGSLTFSDLEIQVFDGENAVVRGRWKLVMSQKTPGGLFTLTFRRFPEGWRIVHDQTSG